MIQGERRNSEDNCTNPSKGRSMCFYMTFHNRLTQITTRRTRLCEDIWLLSARKPLIMEMRLRPLTERLRSPSTDEHPRRETRST